MKFKPFFVATLCAASLSVAQAAPRATATKAKASKPKTAPKKTVVADKRSTPAAPAGAVVLSNATMRNDTASKTTLQLAQNGKALLPIVISAKASDATKLVANDMANYLGKITGADFKIEAGDGTKWIVLGNLKDFALPAFGKSLKIRNGHDGKEA